MTYRVRLRWNRNQDKETRYYRVYRSESPNILDKNRMEYFIMKVAHPEAINPVTVNNELLKRKTNRSYSLENKYILTDEIVGTSFPFIIRVNGQIRTDFTLDKLEGVVLFDNPLEKDDVVIAETYTFDGVYVWDYPIEEEGKEYYGPDAKDLSPPAPPTNVRMEPDFERNRIIIRWNQTEPTGKKFYYRIDAMMNEDKYSSLSEWRIVTLREPLADRPYLIEKSIDGIEWRQIARTQLNVFYEYMIDRIAPEPIRGLKYSIYMYPNNSLAQISLTWDKPINNLLSDTALYRIRAVNKVGAVSEPSAIVGPIPFQVGLDKIIIRRKVYDGTLPSFDGSDAITVGEITDLNQLTFKDEVKDNQEYTYGFWIIDKAGNRSAVSVIKVDVWDATPPAIPTILSIDEFQIVAG